MSSRVESSSDRHETTMSDTSPNQHQHGHQTGSEYDFGIKSMASDWGLEAVDQATDGSSSMALSSSDSLVSAPLMKTRGDSGESSAQARTNDVTSGGGSVGSGVSIPAHETQSDNMDSDRFFESSFADRRRTSETSTISLGGGGGGIGGGASATAETPLAYPISLFQQPPPNAASEEASTSTIAGGDDDEAARRGVFQSPSSRRSFPFSPSSPPGQEGQGDDDDASDSLPSSPLSSASMPASFLSSMSGDEGELSSLAASHHGQMSSEIDGTAGTSARTAIRNLPEVDNSIRLPPSWIVSPERHAAARIAATNLQNDITAAPRRIALDRRATATRASAISSGVVSEPRATAEDPDGQPSPAAVTTSPATSSYIFSRAHWAVEESRRRTEEQGDDLSLVLPSLTLPEDSMRRVDAAAVVEPAALAHQAPETSNDAVVGGEVNVAAPRRRRPQHILLCGTNRTVNGFLKRLLLESSVDVFRLRSTRSGRSSSSSGSFRRSAGVFDVGVFLKREREGGSDGDRTTSMTAASSAAPARSTSSTVEDSTADESDEGPQGRSASRRPTLLHVGPEDARWRSGMVPLAVIHVVGKGQVGNAQKAVDLTESTFKRLDRLLAPTINLPPSVEQDLTHLIEMWAEQGPQDEVNGTSAVGWNAHWYDFGVVTGDARYLADQGEGAAKNNRTGSLTRPSIESSQLRHLTDILPCICWPSSLQTRLGFTERNSPFIKLDAIDHESLAPFVSLLQDIQTNNAVMLEQSVTGFLRYRQFVHDDPHVALSDAPSTSSASAPTGSRSQEWEAGLSRRHAANTIVGLSSLASKTSAVNDLGVYAQRSRDGGCGGGFFEDGDYATHQVRRSTHPSFIAMFLAPLWGFRSALAWSSSNKMAMYDDEQRRPGSSSLWGGWLGVACLTMATASLTYFSLVNWV